LVFGLVFGQLSFLAGQAGLQAVERALVFLAQFLDLGVPFFAGDLLRLNLEVAL